MRADKSAGIDLLLISPGARSRVAGSVGEGRANPKVRRVKIATRAVKSCMMDDVGR